ncbi:thioredoxin fold domain-containing protein [Halosquirtibacter laminarini]|uniref:Thioredoxin fold domain-containing protein n=1 Tax=Halosquirtibacter laminarini TaxID=3374600 RepID=A0AC61NRC9_9BACT|nr:thioredoxin fold domain-containing protein [Prolixibacteraceae bacterium]
MSTSIQKLDKDKFIKKVMNYTENMEWNYQGDKPCIIDFYAEWCSPCKAIEPILEELYAAYKKEIYIYKIDTEKEEELAALFGIQSVPSLLFVPLDSKPQMVQGALPQTVLEDYINTILLEQ